MSLIFVSNCLVRRRPLLGSLGAQADNKSKGFVVGAAANVWLTDRFGFGRVCFDTRCMWTRYQSDLLDTGDGLGWVLRHVSADWSSTYHRIPCRRRRNAGCRLCGGSTCPSLPCLRRWVYDQWLRLSPPGQNSQYDSMLRMTLILRSQLQNAGSNAYVAAFKENTAMKFAILHAVYGMYFHPLPCSMDRPVHTMLL